MINERRLAVVGRRSTELDEAKASDAEHWAQVAHWQSESRKHMEDTVRMASVYRKVPAFNALTAIHVALVFVLAGLGGVLAMPGDTFDSSSAWRLFVDMGWTEEHLSVVFFVASSIGAAGIAPSQPWIRRWSIISLASCHFFLAVTFFLGNPHGGAIVPYIALSCLGLYAVRREAEARYN